MVRIGCIGCGAWGANLLRVWQQTAGAIVAGVCRKGPSGPDELIDQCPEARWYDSAEDLFADDNIQAVCIATPPATHHELAKQALQAHKHVFVEKPMCLNVAHAEELAGLADTRSAVLMVGHLMEHHGAVRAIKQALDRGAIGQLRHLHLQRLKLGRVRSEENVLWSFAPHDISIAGYLLQQTPSCVTAVGHCYVQPGIEDIVFVDADYGHGLSLHLHVSWLHPRTVRQAVLIGSEGMIVWDDMARQDKVQLARNTIAPDLSSVVGETTPLVYDDEQPLQAECAHFVECIASGRRPVNDGWDGVRVVKVLQAATEALARDHCHPPNTSVH